MEYTIITAFSIVLVIILDVFIFKYKFILKPLYWKFYSIMFVLHTVVDNYLNGRWGNGSFIVGPYNSFSGVKILFTPIENYFFGFSMILLNILIFTFLLERFEKNQRKNMDIR